MESELDPLKSDLERLLARYNIPVNDTAELIDECSVPINVERIRRFYRQELTAQEAEETAHLIAHYRPWRVASRQVIAETATEDER
jgi:hypothetical protein